MFINPRLQELNRLFLDERYNPETEIYRADLTEAEAGYMRKLDRRFERSRLTTTISLTPTGDNK